MFAPDGEINQDTLWKEIDQNDLMDSKLRCVFAMPPALVTKLILAPPKLILQEDQNGIKEEAPASSAPEVKYTAPVPMKVGFPHFVNMGYIAAWLAAICYTIFMNSHCVYSQQQ